MSHDPVIAGAEHPVVYDELFSALDTRQEGVVSPTVLLDALANAGLQADDPRLKELFSSAKRFDTTPGFSRSDLPALIGSELTLIKRALQGNLVIPDWPAFVGDLKEIYEASSKNVLGRVADYIPPLGRVNPDQFGASCCTVDGQRFSIGDASTEFCLQSCAKPINYCLALEENGEEAFHAYVGREPSGRGFNELSLNSDNKPQNPMINSGAIATCSLIKPALTLGDRLEHVMALWAKLAGGAKTTFSNSVYLAERQTADRNFALGYFMRENRCFPQGTDLLETLEFYFQCCAIESTTAKLSVVAATLANGGICPVTDERLLQPITVRDCLSLMFSCGMYDFSGEFAFTVGLPAKSGVAGALMLVIPNVMGIALWSPRLDHLGNSVRGIDFSKRLVERFNFHNYDTLVASSSKKRDPRRHQDDVRVDDVLALCWAASRGDERRIRHLVAQGASLDCQDYDGRTPMHLAAAEGHVHMVKMLIGYGVNPCPVDRWGATPIDDAKRGGHVAVVALLEGHGCP